MFAAGSCGGVIDPSKNTQESFSGTMELDDLDIHEFRSENGEYDVRFTAFSPQGNAALTLTLAQLRNGNCEPINSNVSGALNQTVLAGRISSGRYCLVVTPYIMSEPVTYTVRVSHP